jgi:hypothetical protein
VANTPGCKEREPKRSEKKARKTRRTMVMIRRENGDRREKRVVREHTGFLLATYAAMRPTTVIAIILAIIHHFSVWFI